MYRPYAIRPVWEQRRAAQAVAKCYGGGTSSTPTVPPEFRDLILGSTHRMLGQQSANPIGSYNAANPMGVESMSPGQSFGMGIATGNMGFSPFDALGMQAAQRAAGMAGAGPTTGSYDPSGELSLQDWANLGQRQMGLGGEMGTQAFGGRDAAGGGAGFTGGPTGGSEMGIGGMQGGLAGDGQGGSIQDMLRQLMMGSSPSGGPNSFTGGPPNGGAALPDESPLGISTSGANASTGGMQRGSPEWQAMMHQLHPNAAPTLFQGSYQGGGGQTNGTHTFMTYDSHGNVVPLMEQNGLWGQAGKDWGRPSDPVAAAAYDRLVGMGGTGGHGPGGFGGQGASTVPEAQQRADWTAQHPNVQQHAGARAFTPQNPNPNASGQKKAGA